MLRRTAFAIAVCLFVGSAQAQDLGGARQFNWPSEFEGEEVSCQGLIAARPAYLSRPRPAFNCIAGVDCPQDLAPAAPTDIRFSIYHSLVDADQPQLDVNLSADSFASVRDAIEQLLRDVDRVARSRGKTIRIVGHADQRAGDRAAEMGQLIGSCVAAAVDIGLHLNGYSGAYDFATNVESFGAARPMNPSYDEAAWALNRRVEVTVSY